MKSLGSDDAPLFLEAAYDTPCFVIYSTPLYTKLRHGWALALRWCNPSLLVYYTQWSWAQDELGQCV